MVKLESDCHYFAAKFSRNRFNDWRPGPICLSAAPGILPRGESGACDASGRNCVRKSHVNERINRCAHSSVATQLRSVVQAALAVAILLVASTALVPAVSARADSQAVPAAVSAAARMRISAWRYAMRQRGKPYIWGGTGPFGFDCSGLVYAAYRASGLILPRTTFEMLDSWILVRISKSQARRGDLAFFGPGHVELYDWGPWTYGAEHTGSPIGFHRMNAYWHPTMYFRIRL